MVSYKESQDIKNTEMIRKILAELPKFLSEFFRGISDTKTSQTRLSYIYDLRNFFHYILEWEKDFEDKQLKELTLEDLKKINTEHIENFLEYTTLYGKTYENVTITRRNHAKGKARKLSAIRVMFSYFLKKGKIEINPAEIVETPKIVDKVIVHLEIDEIARLLDLVESGEKLSAKQQAYHEKTKIRDLAIITLLLGTGMRVSECVGIDINHINFDINGIKIVRKGGNEEIVYFGDEVREVLLNYLKTKGDVPQEGALFLSMQNKRISTRAVQNLVKKYSDVALSGFKNISPHKLRSTYGTTLYQETGDIYLVASVLGHKNVDTTRKHYAKMDENRRRQAANIVKLRKGD